MSAAAARAPALPRVAVDELLERLEGVRRNGEGRWMARCPAHGDKGPSLSVRDGDGGRVLLHCFGGCDFAAIVAALGLEPRQLFPESADRPWIPQRRRDPTREAREDLERLLARHRPPTLERMRDELRLTGALILGGPRAFDDLPAGFDGSRFQATPMRLLFLAMAELVRQGTPRRRFSLLALSRELDRAGGTGSGARHQVHFWGRLAALEARR